MNSTIREKRRNVISGLVVIPLVILVLAIAIGAVAAAIAYANPYFIILALLGLLAGIFLLAGLFMVNPNEARVLQLFGDYKSSVHEAGLRWANPFYSKRKVSVRVRNFESDRLKVNDHDGNPIEIATVVVWRVVDTAEAIFHVDNYEDFVHVQSEAALRNLATCFPYDVHEEGEISLRSHTGEIAERIKGEMQERLEQAGVEVLEARISHLAYAPEIASAMLQRQQAGAIIAARQRIVDGAVGMVEMALNKLSEQELVELDEERKANMVSNLLVVLCGERAAHPVINAGSLY